LESIRIVSVNIGTAETLTIGGHTTTTGIHKKPVKEPVRVGQNAIGSDIICNPLHHGGPDQAVYVYSVEDYRWWADQLGQDLPPGSFGENLTIDGLPTELYVGDRLLIGDVVLEATAPRIPCTTLAAQMQDRGFGMKFRRAERPGTYFRVMNEGEITVGDSVVLIDNPGRQVSIIELFCFAFALSHDANDLQRYLDAPIAERMRSKVETKLRAIDARESD
jgi:MOSC domain-containing protein YiiM